jgi:transcriptional antiterminator RfaH
MTQRWYVVHTHTHAENKAEANLARQGFATYLPRYQKRRRHARRVETVNAPLFPRYLFVSVDLVSQRWRSIYSTFGVARVICNGDDPAPVPDFVIDGLRRHEDDDGLVQLTRRRFEAGAWVRIMDGAFASCLGLIEGMRDDERVTVLLDLLGRKVRVLMDDLSLAAV